MNYWYIYSISTCYVNVHVRRDGCSAIKCGSVWILNRSPITIDLTWLELLRDKHTLTKYCHDPVETISKCQLSETSQSTVIFYVQINANKNEGLTWRHCTWGDVMSWSASHCCVALQSTAWKRRKKSSSRDGPRWNVTRHWSVATQNCNGRVMQNRFPWLSKVMRLTLPSDVMSSDPMRRRRRDSATKICSRIMQGPCRNT